MELRLVRHNKFTKGHGHIPYLLAYMVEKGGPYLTICGLRILCILSVTEKQNCRDLSHLWLNKLNNKNDIWKIWIYWWNQQKTYVLGYALLNWQGILLKSGATRIILIKELSIRSWERKKLRFHDCFLHLYASKIYHSFTAELNATSFLKLILVNSIDLFLLPSLNSHWLYSHLLFNMWLCFIT